MATGERVLISSRTKLIADNWIEHMVINNSCEYAERTRKTLEVVKELRTIWPTLVTDALKSKRNSSDLPGISVGENTKSFVVLWQAFVCLRKQTWWSHTDVTSSYRHLRIVTLGQISKHKASVEEYFYIYIFFILTALLYTISGKYLGTSNVFFFFPFLFWMQYP